MNDERLTYRYEALRIERRWSTERNLFIRCGMVGWMQVWVDVFVAGKTERNDSREIDSQATGEAVELEGLCGEIVEILATMTCESLRR